MTAAPLFLIITNYPFLFTLPHNLFHFASPFSPLISDFQSLKPLISEIFSFETLSTFCPFHFSHSKPLLLHLFAHTIVFVFYFVLRTRQNMNTTRKRRVFNLLKIQWDWIDFGEWFLFPLSSLSLFEFAILRFRYMNKTIWKFIYNTALMKFSYNYVHFTSLTLLFI